MSSPNPSGSQKPQGRAPSPEKIGDSIVSDDPEHDEDYYTRPDFIYGGPFIPIKLPSPFLDTCAPMNYPLQGTFRKSFAYFSLKERMPVILTKIIDYLSREGSKIASANSASQDEVQTFMKSVAKLKNDLVTNKEYDPLTLDSPNAKKWNKWIESQDIKKYFLNSWMFTECYIYRKLQEGCELTKGLKEFDYFAEQKNKSFANNEEIMCLVADRMVTMIKKSEKDKRKADFNTLLKISLWANRCDLSLSLGSQVDLVQAAKDATEKLRLNPPPPPPAKGKKKKKAAAPAGPIIISADPFQMILDLKDKVLVDDANKVADQVAKRSEKLTNSVNAAKSATAFKAKCSCHRLATKAGMSLCHPEVPPEPEVPKDAAAAPKDAAAAPKDAAAAPKDAAAAPKDAAAAPKDATAEDKDAASEKKEGKKKEEVPKPIPCPAKLIIPQAVMFDIVCDNAGYELFADLCLAHFLVAQGLTQKVRFHVKNMPWFVSDVTPKDFQFVIDACCNSQYSAPSNTGATEEGGEPKIIKADNLRILGEKWKQFVQNDVFLVMAEDYWTYPKCYKEMKALEYNLYRKLQNSVGILFKGDLNYRKLMGDINVNPSQPFLASLQGFIPSPIIAVRTVKSETICGLKKGVYDTVTQFDPKWMQTGDYGLIQYCAKAEALKVSVFPCIDYCTTCFGIICPEHKDM